MCCCEKGSLLVLFICCGRKGKQVYGGKKLTYSKEAKERHLDRISQWRSKLRILVIGSAERSSMSYIQSLQAVFNDGVVTSQLHYGADKEHHLSYRGSELPIVLQELPAMCADVREDVLKIAVGDDSEQVTGGSYTNVVVFLTTRKELSSIMEDVRQMYSSMIISFGINDVAYAVVITPDAAVEAEDVAFDNMGMNYSLVEQTMCAFPPFIHAVRCDTQDLKNDIRHLTTLTCLLDQLEKYGVR